MDQIPIHLTILSLKVALSQVRDPDSVLLLSLFLRRGRPPLVALVLNEQQLGQHLPSIRGSRAVDRDRHYLEREDLSINPNS